MHVPDPVVAFEEEGSEHEVLLAESVGWATRGGSTRSLPLSAHLCRTTCSACHSPTSPPRSTAPEAAAQQLASRPRRRLRNSPEPDRDLARQRRVVDAFLAASRGGDFDALLEVLDSHVELWIDGGALRADALVLLHGADVVAAHTTTYSKLYPFVRPALVNGVAGASGGAHGRVFSVMAHAAPSQKLGSVRRMALSCGAAVPHRYVAGGGTAATCESIDWCSCTVVAAARRAAESGSWEGR